jgi:DNA-binding response OmpR family regulator
MLHVCLAGPVVTGDYGLLDALKAHHEVSLVADPTRLDRSPLLDLSDVLVLDASGLCSLLRPLLRSLRQRHPALPIVLVDGNLTEHDKADAFSIGVLDYFPAPCHIGLLTERLEVLARTQAARPTAT